MRSKKPSTKSARRFENPTNSCPKYEHATARLDASAGARVRRIKTHTIDSQLYRPRRRLGPRRIRPDPGIVYRERGAARAGLSERQGERLADGGIWHVAALHSYPDGA